ncbi:MAG: 30S ribosome-binding factor RbfA [Cardiobacteriaceae bacterium]|nr:30S ribosome-binding factor RbfA [Cardiobacteriaceae bacterium]
MKFDRTKRIGEQMRRDLSQALPMLLSHPRASMLSVTAVVVTRDLSFAKVYVTHILNDEAERQMLVKMLNQQAPQFRHYLAKRLDIRKMPELSFVYDHSVEYGAKMEQKLSALVKDLPDEEEM